jgi:hypothetical protein
MNGFYGKTGQKLHDDKRVVEEDNEEIEKLYLNKQGVKTDIVLANGKQCMLDVVKGRCGSVKDPVHINTFILSYSKVILNIFIAGFDGFTDGNNTFY